jgi:acyl carrier protein
MTLDVEAITPAPPRSVTLVRPASEPSPEVKDTRALILINLQKILRLEAHDINPQTPFQNYGLDSITGMQLALALEKSTGREILPRWLIEYPTVDSLARKLQEPGN